MSASASPALVEPTLADLEQSLQAVVAALDGGALVQAGQDMAIVNAVVAALDPKLYIGDADRLSRIAALHARAQKASVQARSRLHQQQSELAKSSKAAKLYGARAFR